MKQGDDSTSDLKDPRFRCLFCEDDMGCGQGSLYFLCLTRFPHMLGGKQYIATKPPCGLFFKMCCDWIRQYAAKFQNALN